MAHAHDFISRLPNGYGTVLRERGIRLSGGQKQRIALARAIIRKPDILILDEATNALDPLSEKFIQEALNVLRGRCTILIIAHRLSSVLRADKICVLKDGKLVEKGSAAELLQQRGLFFELYRADRHHLFPPRGGEQNMKHSTPFAPWALFDVDMARQQTPLHTGPDEKGMGLLIRRKSKPAAFILTPLKPGTIIYPGDIVDLVREKGEAAFYEQLILETVDDSTTPQCPSLTVAVCTHNRSEKLYRCLNALTKIEFPHTMDFTQMEVLVIDNAPGDDTTRRVSFCYRDRVPNMRYIREERPGLDFARNRAIQEASGALLAYLDDDVVVDDFWLMGLMEAFRENPDAAAFTGPVLPYALETEAQILFEMRGGFRRGFLKMRYGQELRGNPLYPCGSGIFGAGCNMAFDRNVLKILGGFDEALDRGAPLPGGGDLDIFYRVIRSGRTLVYEPGFMVFHEHRKTRKQLRRQYFTWGLGFMAYVHKSLQHDPPMRKRFLRLVEWWFRDQVKRTRMCVSNPGFHPLSFLLAEIWGGIVGLMGTYPRSRNQIEKWRVS